MNTGAQKNMALALCTGCRIGESIDAGDLCASMEEKNPGLKILEHPALCSDEGLKAFHQLAESEGLHGLVLAACSPRQRQGEFAMENCMLERVNLREQLAWTMEAGHEDTRAAAEDQVLMALAKIRACTSQEPYIPEELHRKILVVGGGITGLSAALEGARSGNSVILVEKEETLGGYAAKIYRVQPGSEEALQEGAMATLVEEVESNPLIEVHTGTGIGSISGEPGNFSVVLEKGGDLKAGAIVTATGWHPYDAGRLEHLGYGMEGVRTLEEFESIVQTGKVPDRVLFILCAGSRDEEHLSYCSSYCCGAALKQALYVREKNPGAEVYIVYRDVRTPAFQESFYRMVQEDDAIFMTRGLVEKVIEENGEVLVHLGESLLGDAVSIAADMVVLATGMVPNSTTDLKLQYRLGEGLPELEYSFSDSHFICFPYESRRTGIYAAGTVRAPMDMEQSREDGAGAMLKAIQCIAAVGRGEAMHPRTGEKHFPELYMERCTDCKRCTEECPFGSYDETEKGTPLPNPARCRRCGICLGSCPERVIGFPDFSINSVSSMIKASSMPDEFDEKPRVLVFVCENDAYPALDAAGVAGLKFSPFVRIIPVRCLGSINKVWISDALSHGYDGILQIGCKPGDDYQCHFIHGSELNEQRGENLQETLETMMLEPERIRTSFVEITDHHGIVGIINDYMEEIDLIGPNPFKSM